MTRRAGYVLVGGQSSRMGRDKALLPYGDATLVEHVAARVAAAAGSATLVGPPEPYRALGYPVIADRHSGAGPAAGIEAALRSSPAEWNLVVACDMPAVPVEFLEELLQTAERAGARCLVPVSRNGRLEPLCAVWRRGCEDEIEALLNRGVRKMSEIVTALAPATFPADNEEWFENVNTPADWSRHERSI